MARRPLLAVAAAALACSGDSAPITPDSLELATNGDHYEWIPGVPPSPLTLTLHNSSATDLTVIVCSQLGAPAAPIQYQQRQPDGSWINIPFAEVACDAPGAPVSIAAGSAWVVPPEAQAFPPTGGTYRIVVTGTSLADPTVEFPIASNSFTVTREFEPTS